jgi:hypothetical protein
MPHHGLVIPIYIIINLNVGLFMHSKHILLTAVLIKTVRCQELKCEYCKLKRAMSPDDGGSKDL